jgi:hypothetical protein
VVLLCGRTQDGAGLDVIRKRGEVVQRGVVRPLEDGKPINGEVVKLDQRGNSPLFDVTVHCAVGAIASGEGTSTPSSDVASASDQGTRGHPARVASEDYRRNWDAIWKQPASKSLPN